MPQKQPGPPLVPGQRTGVVLGNGADLKPEVTPVARNLKWTDVWLIFSWVNDPTSRANSLSRRHVGAVEHLKWFIKTRRSPIDLLVVVEGRYRGARGSRPMLFCGFREVDEGIWEITVNMDPEFRGTGHSKALTAEALNFLSEQKLGVLQVNATVREQNLPSLRLFAGLGFKQVSKSNGLIYLLSKR